MRSGHELDVYFKSKRFLKRLDFIRNLGEEYAFAGAISIRDQFELMQNHYGIIQHYLLTKQYDPSKENEHQIEIIDYTNYQVYNSNVQGEESFDELGLLQPQDGVHLLLPPGIKQKDIIEFIKNRKNFQTIKDALDNAYISDSNNKHAFRPVKKIDTYLEIVDRIDEEGGPTSKLITKLSVDYSVDESDIRKKYKRYRAQNNPFLKPV